jgi:VIT1/CCC1 family predicted Fe2+/Mn2+ transporter
MHLHPEHAERHFTASDTVRDVVVGMSDGLTVPFALAAGISGAIAVSHLVVTAGLAEIAAGSIAMGLGGYLAARSDAEHYRSERAREVQEVKERAADERAEVAEVFQSYGLTDEQIAPIIGAFENNPKAWVDFMMRFELGLEAPDPGRARRSAFTIAGAYVAGGFVPLGPYMLNRDAHVALFWSMGLTLIALSVFGAVKGRFTGRGPLGSALETTFVGGLAAAAAFGLAKLFS